MKQFIEVGYKVLFLEEEEVKLLSYLSEHNFLKFTPKKIEGYGH